MADIFTKNDAQRVVEFRIVWLWGDSNIRAVYKDLVWLLQKNTLVDLSSLRNKLEYSFMNDCLVGGQMLHKGRSYMEVRCFENFAIPTKIEFTFLTECVNEKIREKIINLSPADTPDIIVMNSCLWDITRWGPESVTRYKENIKELLQLFKDCLPAKTLVLWTTTPPLSNQPHGGFLINQINFMKPVLRFEVMEANLFVRQEVVKYGFDVLDIHYHLLHQIHRRRPDGIHWNPEAVRHITNLILTHVAISWGLPLPRNFTTPALDQMALSNKNNTKLRCIFDVNNNQVSKTNNDKIGYNNKKDVNNSTNNCKGIGESSNLNNSNISAVGKTNKKKKKNKNKSKSKLMKQQLCGCKQGNTVFLNFGFHSSFPTAPQVNPRGNNQKATTSHFRGNCGHALQR